MLDKQTKSRLTGTRHRVHRDRKVPPVYRLVFYYSAHSVSHEGGGGGKHVRPKDYKVMGTSENLNTTIMYGNN